MLATGSASFTVAENQSLTIIGSEAVSVTPVYQDQPETCTDTVTDRGTQGVTNLPLQQLVIDLDTGTLDQQSSATVTLAAGASQTLPPRTFSTHPLAYGNHTLRDPGPDQRQLPDPGQRRLLGAAAAHPGQRD